MKGSFTILLLLVAGTGAWQYINVPKNRPNNCGCHSDIFCKVVYVNPKTVNRAERKVGRIQIKEQQMSLDIVFDDLGDEIGAGISGSLIEKDGRPYTVEPCTKNTDNERQFHRLIRQHLMVRSEKKTTLNEMKECCRGADKCEKVDVNLDLFKQDSFESVYMETNVDPDNYFDVKTADLFSFKQKKKLSWKTKEKIYTNDKGNLLTLTCQGEDHSAVMSKRGGKVGEELFSLKRCGDDYFWRSTVPAEESYGPGARSKDGNDRRRPKKEGEPKKTRIGPKQPHPLEDEIEIGIRADQGADTCYYRDEYYCRVSQDDLVGGAGIKLDGNNSTATIGQDWCNTKCNTTAGCEFFTWTNFRSVQMCYLMTACEEDRKDKCLTDEPQICMSGPKNCWPLDNNQNCTTLEDWGPGYVDWQCRDYLGNDVDAYKMDSIPWGTVCIQSCDSWRALGSNLSYPIEAHLVSTCQKDSTWSDTVAYDGQDVLLFPPATGNSIINPGSDYPVPNDPASVSLMCGCEPLQMTWPTKPGHLNNDAGTPYDPNTETMTDFLCDYDLETTTVSSNNSCTMFCDNYLTAVVRCWDGGWTGKPALGFWCQNEPGEDRGPINPVSLD